MILSVLLRPKRPLPRRFNRRVSPAMRAYARKRHPRRGKTYRERFRRVSRRAGSVLPAWWAWFRRWWWVMATAVLAAGIAVVFLSPVLQVREIRVQRSQGRLDVARVQEALRPLFGQRLPFISTYEVSSLLQGVLPDVQDMTIEKQYPSRLFLRVTLKPLIAKLSFEDASGKPVAVSPPFAPTASGAVTQPPAVIPGDFLAEGGLYVTAPGAGSGVTLPLLKVVDWEVKPLPGTRLVSDEFLARMQQAEQALTGEFGQKVTARVIYLRGKEFHLSLGRISIWFDMQSSLEEELARFRIFLATVGLKNVTQYVDLRLAGRVVYR